jgi:adenylate cyclase
MAKEIERKFTVDCDQIDAIVMSGGFSGKREISQYYVISEKGLAVRLRKDEGADHAVLAVKSGTNALAVDEFEFKAHLSEYEDKKTEMVGIEISKTRYEIEFDGRTWEVDFFHGELEGLVVAEIECDDAADITNLPEWVLRDVTFDSGYKNAVLALKGLPGR